jgi:tight adherence protein B
MLLLLLLLFILLTAGVFLLAWGIDQRRSAGRVLSDRLAAVRQAEQRAPSEDLALLRDELLSGIPALHKLLVNVRAITRLQRFLSQADVKVRPGKFLAIGGFFGVGIGALAYLWQRQVVLAVLAGLVSCALPLAWVAWKRARRFRHFEELFPNAIDLLGRAVRAGHAFTTALELIANELEEPVSGEFRILFEEQKFGLPLREALLNFSERMPLVDVKFFATAVLLQRETGGNLAEIMDKLSYVIRERFKIHRQVRVYTAQGRLTMMLLMGLPPALLIILLTVNREFVMVLFTDPWGKLLCAIGLGLQILGFFMIRRIIEIRV